MYTNHKRLWTRSGKRMAIFGYTFDGRWEYVVTHRGKHIMEDFNRERLLRSAKAR